MAPSSHADFKRLLFAAGLLGLTGVLAGTVGAHGLKGRLSEQMMAAFEIGVRYQLFHAAVMLAGAAVLGICPDAIWIRRACWLWVMGTAMFSGSLYLLAITELRWLGWIAPLGGVMFLVGWSCVCVSSIKSFHATASKAPFAPKETS